ncbi:hypothetical protein BAE29_05185 [Acidithiobacillus caldus]|uniref:Uncharacterized protein n=1 Tax=Acidithiobacillus caldus TaxID=33059 RepID=A0A1E7YKQ3_9PROT|nr:hypothetical protein BAE27_11420 [Acidithiobacillus caldus]OFC31455.1 hypothetical protein BAE28_12595 [Acidithiobacillus caldus]OFC40504.1 hypothetical protein BAE29_05185 [Acidithiobacillus caldus]
MCHDSQHLEAALDEWNTSAEIYADKGYVGAEREERLREWPLLACSSTVARQWSTLRGRTSFP